MGVFDSIVNTAKNVGTSMMNSAVNVGSNVGTTVQDNSEIAGLKMQINTIEQELDASYATIGRKFVQYVMDSGEMPGIDVSDTLKLMDPKISRLQELQQQLAEAEKRNKDANILREKERAEQEFRAEKEKLDRARQMDVLDEDEYNLRLSTAQKKLDNFEKIRKLQVQCEMNLITKEEMNARIAELTS